jgi:hypothetical protein
VFVKAKQFLLLRRWVRVVEFNATFNDISVIIKYFCYIAMIQKDII